MPGFLRTFIEPERIRSKALTITVCLFLSFIFWIINSLSHDYQTTLTIPIHFEYNEKIASLVSEQPIKVKLSVKGYGWTLLAISFGIEKRYIIIPLSETKLFHRFTEKDIIKYAKTSLEDLQILEVESGEILANIKKNPSKKVVVAIDKATLKLPEGAQSIGKIHLKPTKLEVYGQAKKLEKIPDTLFIKLKNPITQHDYSAEIDISDAWGNDVYSPCEKIQVTLSVK